MKNKIWKSTFTAMADMSVTEIAKIADRRMYEEKSCYYEKCGVDGHCNMDIYKSLDIFLSLIHI